MSAGIAIDQAEEVVGKLPKDPLSAVRNAAIEQLRQHGLPSTKDEDWRYTDLSSIIEISNEWLSAGAPIGSVSDAAVETATAGISADWLIIRNGTVDLASIDALDRPGLTVRPLSEQSSFRNLNAPLAEMNAALLRDGLAISINDSQQDQRPLGLLHIDVAETRVGVSHTRVIIDVAANSTANIVELHVSSGAALHYANSVIDMNLADNACASYVRIQDRDATHSQTGRCRVKLHSGSQLRHSGFDFGGRMIRNDLDIQILGAAATATFSGLYLANEKQHIDNHTRVDHFVGPAYSSQEYRGILADSARCIWNGKAIVHAGADGTDANQANHNLLLSESAEIDAKPELEIYADDVKCSHGTTIGQLDEAALFYLRTRGIDAAIARRLLTRAFAQQVVAMSPLAETIDRIEQRVASKLAQLIAGAAQ